MGACGFSTGSTKLGYANSHLTCPSSSTEASLLPQVAPHLIFLSCLYSRGWGLCLDDPPADDVIDFPSVPPGVLYDVSHQCRLQYGAYSVFCDDMDVSVGHVWEWGMAVGLRGQPSPVCRCQPGRNPAWPGSACIWCSET